MAKNSNKFVVDLGSVELDESSRRKVGALIQSTVLQYLASHTATPLSQVRLLDDVGIQGMLVESVDRDDEPAPKPSRPRKR